MTIKFRYLHRCKIRYWRISLEEQSAIKPGLKPDITRNNPIHQCDTHISVRPAVLRLLWRRDRNNSFVQGDVDYALNSSMRHRRGVQECDEVAQTHYVLVTKHAIAAIVIDLLSYFEEFRRPSSKLFIRSISLSLCVLFLIADNLSHDFMPFDSAFSNV
ncbi:jg27237 [Pararge aegeria aegeria]|uniref:Jg27237 protein n=1 Tax=Pararge aegeria aegeria TaxID=348720 RepID=A0A8S4QD74_9NEOP|nr:jg27237 [Pararge aegeria aegeria]